jgi:hypothetical protein
MIFYGPRFWISRDCQIRETAAAHDAFNAGVGCLLEQRPCLLNSRAGALNHRGEFKRRSAGVAEYLRGFFGRLLATVHSAVADGQVTHPFLLQTSIEPSLLTAQPQRAPEAVLSIHIPTASLPVVAQAAVDSVVATISAAKRKAIARDAV